MAESKFEQLTELLKILNDVATNQHNKTESRDKATENMGKLMDKLALWIDQM